MLLPMMGPENVALVNTKNLAFNHSQTGKKTVLDTAYSLIEPGLVEKKSKYSGAYG